MSESDRKGLSDVEKEALALLQEDAREEAEEKARLEAIAKARAEQEAAAQAKIEEAARAKAEAEAKKLAAAAAAAKERITAANPPPATDEQDDAANTQAWGGEKSDGVPVEVEIHDSARIISIKHKYPPIVTAKDREALKAKVAKKAEKPAIVKFEDVSKVYGTGDEAFTAITDINLAVHDLEGKGEFAAVLGPSGSGKSTLLRLIAGLGPQHPPTTGTVEVDGQVVKGPSPTRGMVFQDYTSFDHRTVLDNVSFGLECQGVAKRERYDAARTWIEKVGLSVKDDQYKYPHQLSGGMRQRVAIARTLILKPRIILMDEPFGALDPSTRMHMQDNLIALWRELEATVFFVTHSIEEAVYLGDRIFILSSSPGTVLEELEVPPPDRPAREMQREHTFQEIVFNIRDTIEQLESSKRAGDD